MNRGRASEYMFAGALTFVTSLSIGNAPYLFFGYGISALGVLTTGMLLEPLPATAVLLVASGAAMSLTALTHSAFTLVVVGAILVRTLQVYVLSRIKKKMGLLGASALAVLLGTVVATFLGLAFYGGDALGTTMTFFDAAFILPAYVIVRSVRGGSPGSLYVGGVALLATFGIFLSLSPFWAPVAALTGVVIFSAAAYFALGRGISRKLSAALLVVAIVGVPLSLAGSAPAFSYNLRSNFYQLYPDSLSASQWTQTNSSSACVQGNIAGAGTVQNGVWGPQRLRVLDTCVTMSGVVEGLTQTSGPANDNDFGIDIRLDPQYSHFLTIGNIVLEGGLMHAEVVPSQQASMASVLASLRPGDRVTITGSLVLDTDHGYGSEVHPVWSIVVAAAG